jgi:hypothetical protein
MSNKPIALTLGQQFELERLTRLIEAAADVDSLRGIAKQLLQAWQTQKAATDWMMRQQLDATTWKSPVVVAEDPARAALLDRPEEDRPLTPDYPL